MAKRVLIVDDSIAIARQLQKIIEGDSSFEVVGHAKNGVEGIKMFTTEKPDIVCMDLVMPQIGGIEAIRTITSLDKNAKIIVISSAGGAGEKVVEALRMGAKNVISKPFEADKVLDALRAL